jgi:hypothetical protein
MEFRPRVVIAESHGHLGTPSNQLAHDLDKCGYDVVNREPEVVEKDVYVLTAVHRGS